MLITRNEHIELFAKIYPDIKYMQRQGAVSIALKISGAWRNAKKKHLFICLL